jgi:hypothetical protein
MASMTDTFKVIPVTTESIDTLESALNAASEDGFVWEGALSITDGPALVVMRRGPTRDAPTMMARPSASEFAAGKAKLLE